jgi:hypothetical protein
MATAGATAGGGTGSGIENQYLPRRYAAIPAPTLGAINLRKSLRVSVLF